MIVRQPNRQISNAIADALQRGTRRSLQRQRKSLQMSVDERDQRRSSTSCKYDNGRFRRGIGSSSWKVVLFDQHEHEWCL